MVHTTTMVWALKRQLNAWNQSKTSINCRLSINSSCGASIGTNTDWKVLVGDTFTLSFRKLNKMITDMTERTSALTYSDGWWLCVKELEIFQICCQQKAMSQCQLTEWVWGLFMPLAANTAGTGSCGFVWEPARVCCGPWWQTEYCHWEIKLKFVCDKANGKCVFNAVTQNFPP